MSSSPSYPAVVLETKDGPLSIPRDQFLAIVRNAEYQADLTAATLREMGLPMENLRLPGNFLLEWAPLFNSMFGNIEG